MSRYNLYNVGDLSSYLGNRRKRYVGTTGIPTDEDKNTNVGIIDMSANAAQYQNPKVLLDNVDNEINNPGYIERMYNINEFNALEGYTGYGTLNGNVESYTQQFMKEKEDVVPANLLYRFLNTPIENREEVLNNMFTTRNKKGYTRIAWEDRDKFVNNIQSYMIGLEQAMEKDKNREEYYKQAYEKEKFPSEPYNVYLGRKFYGNVLQHKHNQSTGLTDKQFKEIMYKNEHYREIAHKYGEKPLHIVLDVKNYLESAAIAITTRNIDLAIGHFAKNKLEEKLAFKVMEELLNEGFNIMYNPNRYKPLKTESPVYRSLAEDILSAYYKVDVPRQQAKQKEIARINELNRNIKQK